MTAQNKYVLQHELDWVRTLGASRNLVLVASNLGAMEIVLTSLMNNDKGMTVSSAASAVQTPFCSHSGALKRIALLREAGLLVAGPGRKRSEVTLRVSEAFAQELMEALGRHWGAPSEVAQPTPNGDARPSGRAAAGDTRVANGVST